MLMVRPIGQTLPVQTTPTPAPLGHGEPRSPARRCLRLIGVPTTPAVRPLPAWFPRNLDLADLAGRIRALLVEQGEVEARLRPADVRHLTFMDLDGTLVDSTTPVPLVHKVTGEPLRYPDTGELVVLGIGADRNHRFDLDKLKERYDLPWDDYQFDFAHSGDLEALLAEKPIRRQVRRMRRNLRRANCRTFVVTARSVAPAPVVAHEYLSRLGADADGVLAGNTPRSVEVLGFDRFDFGNNRTGRRKAIAMAGLISLYGAHNIETVEFHDDSDRNLVAAMQLLPALFPHIRFGFHDVVYQRHGHVRSTIAEAHGGVVRDEFGRPMSDADIAAYRSHDAPRIPGPGAVEPENRG